MLGVKNQIQESGPLESIVTTNCWWSDPIHTHFSPPPRPAGSTGGSYSSHVASCSHEN